MIRLFDAMYSSAQIMKHGYGDWWNQCTCWPMEFWELEGLLR